MMPSAARSLSAAGRAAVALLGAALFGCGGTDDGALEPTPMPADLPGVYAGEFPCSNCAAIAATLWLRADQRFVLRQAYLDESRTASDRSYALGRWEWDELAAEIVLRGRGPERRIAATRAGRLELKTASPVPHVLERDPAAPAFADRVRLEGDSRMLDKGASAVFTECATGLPLPVAGSGAFKELRRQHRNLNGRGKPALTTVEAHIETISDDAGTREVLVLDRVLGLKPGVEC
jgi:hypothetical protein